MNWSEFIQEIQSGLFGERMSDLELSNATGIGREVIYKIKTGQTQIPRSITIAKLEDYFFIKIDDRDPNNITYKKISEKKQQEEKFKGEMPVHQYPILATVYAGEPELLDHEVFEDTEYFVYKKNNHRCFALRVNGNSMETTLHSGDTVLVDMDAPLEDGCLVAVKLKNGNQYIKRYYNMNFAFIKLSSDNPDYDVRLIDKNDLLACYRVVSINLKL